MTATEVLREVVTQYLKEADEKTLRMVQAIMHIELVMDWDDMPEELQIMIDESIKEAEEGKGIPHEEMVKKYPDWFRPLSEVRKMTLNEAICQEINELIDEFDHKTLRIIKAILEVHKEFGMEDDEDFDEEE